MAFNANMEAAARRHLAAAVALRKCRHDHAAAYLFGIAAECAVKAMMVEAGVYPSQPRSNDPHYDHFPQLRTAALDRLDGRRGATLSRLLQNSTFMGNWTITIRYAEGKDINPKWIDDWAEHARQSVASIGT